MEGLCEAAFEQSDLAACITDPQGILLKVNDAYRKLYLFPDAERLVGRPVSLIRSPLTPGRLHQDLWRIISSGGVWRGQMNNRAYDGSEVHIHLTISPIRSEGRLIGYLGLSLDRAQQVILENQLSQANKIIAVGALGSGLAHGLNNPLASILLDAEYLREILGDIIASPEADQAGQAAQAIIRSAEKMRRVLEHLLLYAKQEAPQSRSTIALAPFLQDCFLFVGSHLKGLGIEVALEADPDLIVIGNRMELESVIHALISNSMDAFSVSRVRDKKIRVAVASVSGERHLQIEYADNAGGIAPEALPRIFEPFFTTKGEKGTGLGLSLSRHILAAHNGQIDCASERGKTVFLLTLPLAAENGTETNGTRPAENRIPSGSADGPVVALTEDQERGICDEPGKSE
jgi:PAS domain S-box-containing protein